MDVKEAGEKLEMHPNAVAKLCRDGKLRAVRDGIKWEINSAAVEEYKRLRDVGEIRTGPRKLKGKDMFGKFTLSDDGKVTVIHSFDALGFHGRAEVAELLTALVLHGDMVIPRGEIETKVERGSEDVKSMRRYCLKLIEQYRKSTKQPTPEISLDTLVDGGDFDRQ